MKPTTESMEQQGFVTWFRSRYPGVLIFAIPNGGKRSIRTALTLKAEGVVPGVPDLFIPEWRLFIEMKRTRGGIISKEQKAMMKYLKETCNYSVIVGYGAEDASKKLLDRFFPMSSTTEGFVW